MACIVLSALVSLYIQKPGMITKLIDCRFWKGTNNLGLKKKSMKASVLEKSWWWILIILKGKETNCGMPKL